MTAIQRPGGAGSAGAGSGSAMVTVHVTVNGQLHQAILEPHRSLLELLREDLELTGTKRGCDAGDCGACSVIMDGRLVASCLVLAPETDGSEVRTVEGVALDDRPDARLHPLQAALREHAAVQCGFCTPGMVMAGLALLEEQPHPTEAEVRAGIAGNLCRCTGYSQIVEAVQAAAGALAETDAAAVEEARS